MFNFFMPKFLRRRVKIFTSATQSLRSAFIQRAQNRLFELLLGLRFSSSSSVRLASSASSGQILTSMRLVLRCKHGAPISRTSWAPEHTPDRAGISLAYSHPHEQFLLLFFMLPWGRYLSLSRSSEDRSGVRNLQLPWTCCTSTTKSNSWMSLGCEQQRLR